MTLLRQLILVIIMLFTLLFAGTLAINVSNTRYFLNAQLQTTSQDMATSLGLSMSPHMEKHDVVVLESMVDAVFDSGDYHEVMVADAEGQPLIRRVQPVPTDVAPEWFVKFIPIETPKAAAPIMAGWRQGGGVSVSANPVHAYETLWNNTIQSFFLLFGTSFALLLLGMLALYHWLKPLRALEAQAKAISDSEYPVQTHLPWTYELRSVVEAMNLMSVKVRAMFSEQNRMLEHFRDVAYHDRLTSLANRNYFEMQLRHLIESEDEFGNGAIALLEIENILGVNERLGYQRGDALLKGVADLIRERVLCSDMTDCIPARLSGTTFAVIMPDVSSDDALGFVASLSRSFPELQHQGLIDGGAVGHIGLALYRGQTFAEMMSEADMALRAAQIKGVNAFHLHDALARGSFSSLGATQWIALLRRTVGMRKFKLLMQPCVKVNDQSVLQHEILLRIVADDGSLIPAGIFIPMVCRHGFMQMFDRMVITEVMARLEKNNAIGKVAINLLPGSVADQDFIDWLHGELTARPQLAKRLCFEVSDYTVMRNLRAMEAMVHQLAGTGAEIGIDHFGRGFSSVRHLDALKISYIKIDGSFIRGIDSSRDNQAYVESLINIAHGLDIQAFAESVESEAEQEAVMRLRCDGMQGFGIQRPVIW